MTQAVSVEDSSTPANKLKVNSDGSINVGSTSSSSTAINDGTTTTQKATVDGSGNLHTLESNSSTIATNTTGLATQTTLASAKSDLDTIVTQTVGLATQSTLSAAKTDLDTIVTNTGHIPAQGAATTSASTPVNIASDQIVPIKRNCVAVYTLASTATSGTTQNSGDLTVGPYTEISIDVNPTTSSGTSPTLQLFWDRKGSDGIYYPIWQSAIYSSFSSTTYISTSIGAGMAYNLSLGATGRLRWVIGGTSSPSVTFSISVYGK